MLTRLVLDAMHGADDIPYLVRFKTTGKDFVQNSVVYMADLHAIQEVEEDPVIELKMLGGFPRKQLI